MDCPSAYRSAFSSIPSKYSTQVIGNAEREGFQSKAARFTDRVDDTPGPGSYSAPKVFSGSSPSYGQRGTGSFASRTKRMPYVRGKHGPTPSTYNVGTTINKRNDFSSQNSACFQKPVVVEQHNRTRRTRQPAPNQYNTRKYLEESRSAHACESSFKSKTVRYLEKTIPSGSNVSPAKYDPVRPKTEYAVTCFRSKVDRLQKRNNINDNPGPGAYDPENEVKTYMENVYTALPRKHGLLISAAAMPMPKTPPLPGPGAYEIGNFKTPEKTFMSSAAFKSGTSRLTNPETNGVPGPGHYQPKLQKKKTSYYFNLTHNKKWLGV